MPARPPVGIADVATAVRVLGATAEALEAIARCLGIRLVLTAPHPSKQNEHTDSDAPPTPVSSTEKPPPQTNQPTQEPKVEPPPPVVPEAGWQIRQIREPAGHMPMPAVIQTAEPLPRSADFLPPYVVAPSLLPARLSRAFLRQHLAIPLPTDDLDLEAFVDHIGRGDPLRALPTVHRRGIRNGVALIVDTGTSMESFRADAQDLEARLRSILGPALLSTVWGARIPDDRSQEEDDEDGPAFRMPKHGTTVLIVSDLGTGAIRRRRQTTAAEWRAFIQRLIHAQCHVVAVTPYGPDHWPTFRNPAFKMVYWGAGRMPSGQHRPEELALLLSPAGILDRSIIRHARQHFFPLADAGLEARLLASTCVAVANARTVSLNPQRLKVWRSELSHRQDLRTQALAFLTTYRHAHRTTDRLAFHEGLVASVIEAKTDVADAAIARVIHGLTAPTQDLSLVRWAAALSKELPDHPAPSAVSQQFQLVLNLHLGQISPPIPGELRDQPWMLPAEVTIQVQWNHGQLTLTERTPTPDQQDQDQPTLPVPATLPRHVWVRQRNGQPPVHLQVWPDIPCVAAFQHPPLEFETVSGALYQMGAAKEEHDNYAKALRRIKACHLLGPMGLELDLSNLELKELPREVGQLSALKELRLHGNWLSFLPLEIGQLSALTRLDLQSNLLTALPPEIGQLSALTRLSLAHNQLSTLPPEIGQLSALARLSVYNNELTALPPVIGQLTSLTELYLDNNQLTALPPEIGQLTALTQLNLNNNQLTALPAEIRRLTALIKLSLFDNPGLNLPPEVLGPRWQAGGDFPPFAKPNDILDYYFAQLQADKDSNADVAYAKALKRIAACRKRGKKGLSLRLNYLGLTTLPPGVGQLSPLKELDLSGNEFTTLPPEILKLSSLKKLYLCYNHLTALPSEIGKLSALTQFNLASNQFTALPPEIDQLRELRQLDLSGNQLTTLPPEIGKLTELKELDLANNQLTALPPELRQLSALTQLYLHNNPGLNLPPDVLGPPWKDASDTNPPARPSDILDYYFAQHPEDKDSTAEPMGEKAQAAYDAALRKIDECRRMGLRGTSLDLSHLGLTVLPPEIGQLSSLTVLHLTDNQLTALPPEIGRLSALTVLYLANNQLSALPPEIGQLSALTYLSLSNNQLTVLPPQIGQLRALTTLSFSNNRLTALPPEIGQLSALTVLSLTDNQLTELPPQIGRLSTLKELLLNNNQLTALPLEIGQLTALTVLSLTDNHLTALPPEIGHLSSLTWLYLTNNQLTALPPEIGHLSALTKLFLHDNPGLNLPPEVLGPTPREESPRNPTANPSLILGYYFARQRGQSRPLNEVKVLVLGEVGVGKTTLIRQLRGMPFEPMLETTHGIERHRMEMDCPPLGKVRLNLWDFGEQDILHATHQFFLTQGCVYLLVLDSRQSERQSRLDYWLRLIAAYGGDSPAIVVSNMADQQVMNPHLSKLQQEHPNIMAFARGVSSYRQKGDSGLPELRALIAQAVTTRVPDVGQPMQEPWQRVMDALEKDERPFLTLREYHQFAANEGIREARDREMLLRLLHQLGRVLHFSEHSIFDHDWEQNTVPVENLIVLDPNRVTEPIYRLLNDRPLIRAGGLMTRRDLRRCLGKRSISHPDPANLESFILAVMRRFELCFPYDGDQDRWLLPDLLPKEAVDTGDWTGTLAFRYQYRVLPGSVISRLMVRLHSYIARDCLWRTGAKLIRDDCEALVRSEPEAATIDIHIRGGTSVKRRELLAQLRDTLANIHRSFSGYLGAQELVPVPGSPGSFIDYEKLLAMEAAGRSHDMIELDGKLIEVDVSAALNGVSSSATRKQERDAMPHRRRSSIGDTLGINIHGSNYGIIGSGNTQHIQNSFNTISDRHGEELGRLFEKLQNLAEELADEMIGKNSKAMQGHIAALVEEARNPLPDPTRIRASGEGVIDTTFGYTVEEPTKALATAVIDITEKIMRLLNKSEGGGQHYRSAAG